MSWPTASARALGDRVLALEHVGSTSVPDLPAKPIIDIDLTVTDSSDEAAYVPALEQVGFVLQVREPGWHRAPLHGRNVTAGQSACLESRQPRGDPAPDVPRLAA